MSALIRTLLSRPSRLPKVRDGICRYLLLAVLLAQSAVVNASGSATQPDPEVAALAAEVHWNGWIIFGARSSQGDYDLFACRPDGAEVHPLTRTPEWSEFSPQVSRDGHKLMYRRIACADKIDNNRHGEQGELVISNLDGSEAAPLGRAGEFPWASWSPDGTQIVCLSIKGFSFVDLSSRRVLRTLPRKGFFQQTIWSPDGRWICGVANSFGTGWSIARMSVDSGETEAVNVVDCCTPDWFPDSAEVIFSWRPPGQKTNRGYGWTQLWRAERAGKNRRLIYAEDGRHIYGGHISPDSQYALFTGNMEEDGDPGHSGAPMALVRVRDTPIIRRAGSDLRHAHSEAKTGPVLELPIGWEPCWTAVAALGPSGAREPVLTAAASSEASTPVQPASGGKQTLREELHEKGWIAFSAKVESGDWDLFVMRPDGSDRRHLTNTREFNEVGVRFSPDGQRLLYYRMPKSEAVDNNTYGTFELVIARADGSEPVSYGTAYPWASWSPDSRQIACLTPKAIRIVELASRAVIRELPRRGIVSQLVWSPDGRKFTGTANGLGQYWNIGCLDAGTGAIQAVSETDRYNCTSDWYPDSQHIVYARGIIPQQPGRAELWVGSVDGKERRRIYAEPGRHIYGACASPDGKYVMFTRSEEDLGRVGAIEMAIIRWPGPLNGTDKAAPTQPERVDLGAGWEPHWTMKELARIKP